MTAPVLRSSRLVSAYRCYLSSSNSTRFSDDVGKYYSTSTLVRLLMVGGIELRRAAALALGMLGTSEAIEPLGRRLNDADRGVRMAADDSFRSLLSRDAAPTHQHQLLQIMHLNDGGEFAAALSPALILADQAPEFCEAHHQLAVCWLGLGDLYAAEDAYRACLWRCRFHYAAWVGLAHCHLQVEDPDDDDLLKGLNALQRALSICPDLEGARMEVRKVERILESNWRDFLADADACGSNDASTGDGSIYPFDPFEDSFGDLDGGSQYDLWDDESESDEDFL